MSKKLLKTTSDPRGLRTFDYAGARQAVKGLRGVLRKYRQRFNSWSWRDQALVGALVLIVAAANLLWVQLETRPPHWDMAYHLTNARTYFETFKGGHLKALLLEYHYYPPLLYLLTIIVYVLFGISVAASISVNIVFITVLAFSTYGIGKELYSRHTGLVAAVFGLSTPMLVTQFKEFQLDAPLTAMVALSIYLLIASDFFRRRWHTILFGVSVGLGLLTKWTFPFILALPVLGAVGVAVRRSLKTKDYNWVFSLSFAVLLAYAVASPWYITNIHQLHIDLASNGVAQGAREGDPAVGSLASNLYYINNLMNFQLYLLPLLLFISGIVATFRNRDLLRRSFYPFLLITGTVLFFTILRNKDARYTLPILPAIAVVAVAWLEHLGRWRKSLVSVVVGYSLITFFVISFGSRLLPQQIVVNLTSSPVVVYAQHGYIIGAPSHEQWHQEELVQLVSGLSGPKTLAYSGPDTIWFNGIALNYYGQRYGVAVVQPGDAEYWAVRKEGNPEVLAGFSLVKSWQLLDHTGLTLYKRLPGIIGS